MRIAIIGAGGIGGHLAVRLAEAGNAVSLLARGAHLAAIRERGLTLRTPEGETTARFEAVSDTGADLPPANLVIFATKAHDLDGAMEAAAPLMEGAEMALPILNGVEATERLAARFGAEKALIGIARLSAFIEAPGVVVQATAGHSYTLGEADGSQETERLRALHALFATAGIATNESADVRVDLWRKFVGLTAFSATTAGARCDAGTVTGTPALAALYRRIAGEVVALAAAEGIALPETMPEDALGFLGTFEPGIRASMAHDLAAGKPIEIDWLSGAVVRLSARHGLSAPANETVTALLAPWREGARA